MKSIITKVAFAAILTIGFSPLYAGGNHDDHDHGEKSHPKIDEAKAKLIAVKQLNTHIDSKKLKSSWLDMPVHKIEQKTFNSKLEWVVRFKNPKIKDANRQILYVFVNLHGRVTGSNFTGK
jgi:hypothetical protein